MEAEEVHKQFAWNCIVVIESLPKEERTGQELVNSMLRWRAEQYGFRVGYASVYGREDFIQALEQVVEDSKTYGLLPILHIEAHGSTEGLKMESGETVPWVEFANRLRDLNIITHNNLLVILASCYATEIYTIISVLFRAPFWGALAPVEKVSVEAIQVGFYDFYEKMINSRDFVDAVCALNQYGEPTFQFINAEELFHEAWDSYRSQETIDSLNSFVDYLVENGNISPRQTPELIRDSLISGFYEGEKAKPRFFRFYMMLDELKAQGD